MVCLSVLQFGGKISTFGGGNLNEIVGKSRHEKCFAIQNMAKHCYKSVAKTHTRIKRRSMRNFQTTENPFSDAIKAVSHLIFPPPIPKVASPVNNSGYSRAFSVP